MRAPRALALSALRLPAATALVLPPRRHVGNDLSDVIVRGAHTSQRSANITPDDGMRDVLTDWWLLASADIIVGNLLSGFVRSAVVASATGTFDQGANCMFGGDCCAGNHATLGPCFIPVGSGT